LEKETGRDEWIEMSKTRKPPVTQTNLVPTPNLINPFVQEQLKNPIIKNKISIEYFLSSQLMQCLLAAKDPEGNFGENVLLLIGLLPTQAQERLMNYKDTDCTESIPDWSYKTFCGQQLGTPENPILDDRGNAYSPVPITRTEIDYYKLFDEVMSELQKMRLTWTQEEITTEFQRNRPSLEIPIEIRKVAEEKLQELVSIMNQSLDYDITLRDFLSILMPEPTKTPIFKTEDVGEEIGEDVDEGIELGEEEEPENE